jgi:formiminoglutamase
MSILQVTQGTSPLVLGFPHTGTDMPNDIARKLSNNGSLLADTDWHVHQLYADLVENVTTVRAKTHRYVIDLNRNPSGDSLYPGQNTTGLVPLTDFDGVPIWRDGGEPDTAEIARRVSAYHAPYHNALVAELERVKALHGFAILYDCHSIRSRVPFLFNGVLPDFNIGTNDGTTCAVSIQDAVTEICSKANGYRTVLNGRFKGGWTTRAYGRPTEGLHAIQMELAQITHLETETPPFAYSADRAMRLRAILAPILQSLIDWRPA